MNGDGADLHSEVAGNAHVGVSMQVGNLHGGIHVHHPDRLSLRAVKQVPAATQHFTNRDEVIAAGDRAISAAVARGATGPHILVLRGAPGIGKREVARYWLARHQAEFPDGQFYADLSGSADLGDLEKTKLREFLLAANHDPAVIPETTDGLGAWFRSWSTGKRVAVVLERALAPSQVRMLLPGQGQSVVLVTEAGSLEGLSADLEVTFLDLVAFETAAAQDLLGRLIGEQRVNTEPVAVRSLVRICEGLPIALCVVGPMAKAFPSRPLSRLADQLEDDERRLSALSKHKDLSLTVVFDRAYLRLTDLGRRCYRALSFHPGSTPVGIQVLGAVLDIPEYDVRDIVDELLTAHLLLEVATDRYRIEGWSRLYAREIAGRKEFAAERWAIEDQILAFYEHGLSVASVAVLPGRSWQRQFFPEYVVVGADTQSPTDWWGWLELERGNLRACVEMAYRRGEFRRVCHLAVMLWPLHDRGKYDGDHIAVNTRGLEAAEQLADQTLIALIGVQLGFPYLTLGRPDQAADIFSTALDAARTLSGEDRGLEATALEALGLARIAQGRTPAALVLLRENLDLAKELGAPRRTALARFHLAKAESGEVAVKLLHEALDGFVGLDPPDSYNAAHAQLWMGWKLIGLDQLSAADNSLRAAAKTLKAQGKPFDNMQVLEALGDLLQAGGDATGAAVRYQEALSLADSYRYTSDADRLRAKIDPR